MVSIAVGGLRKFTPQMVFGIAALPPENWDDLAVPVPERRCGGRQIMADHFVQSWQLVVGNHREHVMLDMIVHVPVNEPADRVEQYRS